MNQYEAMFLFDPTFGSSYENCEKEIRRLMERAQAEIILCGKWDERRLAFKIAGRKRGVYVLVYFKAPPDKIVSLERDVQLSEDVLRILVVRAEGLTRDQMERALPTTHKEEPVKAGDGAEAQPPPAAADTEVLAGETASAGEPEPVATETTAMEALDEEATTKSE